MSNLQNVYCYCILYDNKYFRYNYNNYVVTIASHSYVKVSKDIKLKL